MDVFSSAAFPVKAAAVFGECSFDRDLCGYRNQSGTGLQSTGGPLSKAALERKNPNRLTVLKDSVTWKLATPSSRPANLQDHSFRAPSKKRSLDSFAFMTFAGLVAPLQLATSTLTCSTKTRYSIPYFGRPNSSPMRTTLPDASPFGLPHSEGRFRLLNFSETSE